MDCIALKGIIVRGRYHGAGARVDLEHDLYEHFRSSGSVDLVVTHEIRARAAAEAAAMTELAIAEAEAAALAAAAPVEAAAASAAAAAEATALSDEKPRRGRARS